MVVQSKSDNESAVSHGALTHSEIFQQPDLWPITLDLVSHSAVDVSGARPVIITGAGTSAYAAAAITASWRHAQGVPATDLLIESRDEMELHSPGFADSGLLISVARSGDSPESVAVVNRIKRLLSDVEHLAITCNGEGHLARMPGVQAIVLDPRTNDRSLAMTSSFSNLVLAGLSLRHQQELQQWVPSICTRVQMELSNLDRQAQWLAKQTSQRVVILASGSLQPLAAEASLKILEMTAGRVVTLPETFLGLRHGPMSFLTPDTLVLAYLSSSAARRRYEEDLLRELRQKQLGQLIGIVPGNAPSELCDETILANAANLPDKLRVPFEIPFAQLLAYHLSLKEGLDPDNPSPLGAITRVVQKFVIYDENPNV